MCCFFAEKETRAVGGLALFLYNFFPHTDRNTEVTLQLATTAPQRQRFPLGPFQLPSSGWQPYSHALVLLALLRTNSLLDSISLGSKLKVTWTMAYNSREMTFVALFPVYTKKIFKRTGVGVMQHSSTKISEMKPNGMDWGSGPFPVTFFFVHLLVKQLQQK